MDILIKLLGEQWLIGLIQLVLGKLIKPQLAEKLLAAGVRATAIIPILNLLVAYLGFQLLPVSAAAAGFIAAAIPIKEGISVIGLALLQTVMVTGTHSTLKNTVGPAAKVGLKWLFSKLAPLVKKLYMLRLLTDDEVVATYGNPSKFIVADGSIRELWRDSALDSFELPKPLPLSWGGVATRVSCNKKVKLDLERIFMRLAAIPEAWGTINDYGGCYNWRRNTNDRRKLSRHAWGIAVDLDVADNPNGSKGNVHPLVIQAFYDEGWLWGGWFSNPDPMHFEKAAVRV